jgi:hypothetical protein
MQNDAESPMSKDEIKKLITQKDLKYGSEKK